MRISFVLLFGLFAAYLGSGLFTGSKESQRLRASAEISQDSRHESPRAKIEQSKTSKKEDLISRPLSTQSSSTSLARRPNDRPNGFLGNVREHQESATLEPSSATKQGSLSDASRKPGSVRVSSYSDLDPKVRSELEDKLKAYGIDQHLFEGKSVFRIKVSQGETYVPFNRLGKVCAFLGSYPQKLQLRIREDGTVKEASLIGAERQPVPDEVYQCTFTPQKLQGQPTQVATIFFPAVASR